MTLLFLQSNLAYLQAVTDPFFYANSPFDIEVGGGATLWSMDTPLQVLGCTEQHELCNKGKCWNFAVSKREKQQRFKDLGFNSRQVSTAGRILNIIESSTVWSIVEAVQGSQLQANQRVWGELSLGLPNDQWALEAEHLFGTMLNNIQVQSVEFVTGPNSVETGDLAIKLPEKDQWMCGTQIVRRDDYASFNILGLVLILVLGGVFWIGNLFIDIFVRRVQHFVPRGEQRMREWDHLNVLQLHRQTLETSGISGWSGETDGVPIISSSVSSLLLRTNSNLAGGGNVAEARKDGVFVFRNRIT